MIYCIWSSHGIDYEEYCVKNEILICYCRSQILELRHIFKGYITYLYAMIFPCILMTRHQYILCFYLRSLLLQTLISVSHLKIDLHAKSVSKMATHSLETRAESSAKMLCIFNKYQKNGQRLTSYSFHGSVIVTNF